MLIKRLESTKIPGLPGFAAGNSLQVNLPYNDMLKYIHKQNSFTAYDVPNHFIARTNFKHMKSTAEERKMTKTDNWNEN